MNKLNVYKKIGKKIAIISGTMLLGSSLVGCGESQNKALLENTLLEQTRVISFDDGHIDVVELEASYNTHKHYKSIITSESFSTKDCNCKFIGDWALYKYDIKNDESIVSYLTEEEIIKASKDELTEEDITNILARIVTEKEEIKTK